MTDNEMSEYVKFNNKDFSDITIKFTKYNMYLNLSCLKQKTDYFKSFESFNKCNNDFIIEAKNIHNKELPIQKVLTWIYFSYVEIIKPCDNDYISLLHLYNFLLIEDNFLEQVFDLMYKNKDEIIFYKSLIHGFGEYLFNEETIIRIHKLFINFIKKYKIEEKNFKKSSYTNYCEKHCLCKLCIKYHSIAYILPVIWLSQINNHTYPVNIINFRKSIKNNFNNEMLKINIKDIKNLIPDYDDIVISISIIYGEIVNN